VSKATVSRFVAKLGFDDFQAFRQLARAEAERPPTGSPLELMTHQLAATGGRTGDLLHLFLTSDITNLERTYRELTTARIDPVVDLLVGARDLYFVDFRKQFAFAYYAATLFEAIRPRVWCLPRIGASPVDALLDVTADDVVVVFPFRRALRDHELLAGAATDAGAALISIGDVYPNPAHAAATHQLRCHTTGVGLFDSAVAPMSIITLLFTATANRIGDGARERLAALERQHAHWGTFLLPDA
jgi:DNA-binding MurR/RpiR family transcriptional regulator